MVYLQLNHTRKHSFHLLHKKYSQIQHYCTRKELIKVFLHQPLDSSRLHQLSNATMSGMQNQTSKSFHEHPNCLKVEPLKKERHQG